VPLEKKNLEPTAEMVGIETADTRLAAAKQASVSALVNMLSEVRLASRGTIYKDKPIWEEVQVQLMVVGQRTSECMTC